MEICYCKNEFKEKVSVAKEELIIITFKKGEYYKFYFEDTDKVTDTVWVIYDEDGKPYHQGLRFHNNKTIKRSYNHLFPFYKYFDYGRLMKLKKLKEIENE